MKQKPYLLNGKKDQKSVRRSPLIIRFLAAIISPIFFLLLIEVILWLAGFGQPKDFFIRWKSAGETLYLTNRHYCEHFVPKELSRDPEFSVLHNKRDSTIRIFVLGSSAAYGDPEPAYGFCRQLELLLNEHSDQTSPSTALGTRFEVINAAVTSMNSHVARRIAKDCASHDPDVFIIYMGNNEVVGPYGPPTLPASLYSSRAFINACITAKKETRIGQLLKSCIRALRTSGKPEKKWLGMEAFLTNQIARDDGKLKYCYQHFRDNISDIIQTAYNSGAKTILCTVPTNIHSCAPFVSKHKDGLTKEQIAEWDRYFREGREFELSGDFKAALVQYDKAKAIDDVYADLSFCMGKCLYALGRDDEAKQKFAEARDLDTLRFRADSQINSIIREVGKTLAQRGVILLDLEENLEKKAGHPSLGEDFLADHVHLNFRGNFLAANWAMQVIKEILPEAKMINPEHSEGELLDLCRGRLLYDENEQYRLAMDMYRRKTLPPFAGQINHETELAGLREGLFALRRKVKGSDDPEAKYLDSIEHTPFDSYLNRRYGEFLLKKGRIAEAIRVYEKLLTAQPFNMNIQIAFAQALVTGSMKDKAINVLTSKESPDRASLQEALLMLGAYCVQNGRFPEADTIYQELNRIEPDNVDVLINIAAAALYKEDLDSMKRSLDRALKIDPESVQVMINMGNYYAKKNQPGEAQKWFARAVQADPQNYLAQIGLGVQTIKAMPQRSGNTAGQLQEGIEHITKAVQLKPDFADGYQILSSIYSKLGKEDEAKKHKELGDLFQP